MSPTRRDVMRRALAVTAGATLPVAALPAHAAPIATDATAGDVPALPDGRLSLILTFWHWPPRDNGRARGGW